MAQKTADHLLATVYAYEGRSDYKNIVVPRENLVTKMIREIGIKSEEYKQAEQLREKYKSTSVFSQIGSLNMPVGTLNKTTAYQFKPSQLPRSIVEIPRGIKNPVPKIIPVAQPMLPPRITPIPTPRLIPRPTPAPNPAPQPRRTPSPVVKKTPIKRNNKSILMIN